MSTVTKVQAYLRVLADDPLRDDLRLAEGGSVVGRYSRCEIASAFQPVVRAADGRIEAAQALARVHAEGGSELSPWNLFALAADEEQLVTLDRRCRIVHTLNFFKVDPPGVRLLFNVHERLLSAVAADHGRAFRAALDGLAIPSRRTVILLPPLTRETLDRQVQVIGSYRVNGFGVAVAPTEPALLRAVLARIAVDVVRVDSAVLDRPDWSAALAAARELGAEVHATRVGLEADRERALDLGVTHLQGRLIGEPRGSLAEAFRLGRMAAAA